MVPKVTATENRGRISVKAYVAPDAIKITKEMTATEIIFFFITTDHPSSYFVAQKEEMIPIKNTITMTTGRT